MQGARPPRCRRHRARRADRRPSSSRAAAHFVCWTRAGTLDVAGGEDPAARLGSGPEGHARPRRPVLTESFAVNRSTLEITTSGPVLPFVTMRVGPPLAGFVPPASTSTRCSARSRRRRRRRAHRGGARGPRPLRRHADAVGERAVTVARWWGDLPGVVIPPRARGSPRQPPPESPVRVIAAASIRPRAGAPESRPPRGREQRGAL